MRRLLCLASLLLATSLQAGIQTKEITYSANGTKMKGYLAWDDAVSGPRPGVLVVHEWWGLNDYARSRARQIAALGYTALAVDMFGGGKVASHPKEAGAFVGEVAKNAATSKSRFLAALETLKAQPHVNSDKIAAIGYCFGGATVLSMARQGVDLAAVVSFHGSLGGLAPLTPPVKAKVLVCHGADDSFISEEQIATFKKEMNGTDTKFISYTGAKHGFTNPGSDQKAAEFGLDVAYNQKADQASWSDAVTFLEKALGKP
jgi:dienelactone hydrolase